MKYTLEVPDQDAGLVLKLRRFKPGLRDGQPVAASYMVPVTFALQD